MTDISESPKLAEAGNLLRVNETAGSWRAGDGDFLTIPASSRVLVLRSAPIPQVLSLAKRVAGSSVGINLDLLCQKSAVPAFAEENGISKIIEYPDGVGFDVGLLPEKAAAELIPGQYDAVILPLHNEDGFNYGSAQDFARFISMRTYEITPTGRMRERIGLINLATTPRQHIVAVSSRCDVACIFCASGDRRGEFGSDFPYASFKKILSSLKNPHAFFGLLLGGEPFLNPELMDMARDIKAHGRFLSITTHANLITPELARQVVAIGVDDIRISVHGGDKHLYEKVMIGASWEKLLSGLTALKEAREAVGSSKPALSFIMIGMKLNIHLLPDLTRLASRYGVSKVIVNAFMPNPRVKRQSLMDDIALLRRYYEEAKAIGQELGVRVTLEEADQYRLAIEKQAMGKPSNASSPSQSAAGPTTRLCLDPWINVHLYETGVVLPCCGGIRSSFGDLGRDELLDIWNGRHFTSLRKEILTGRLRSECEACQLRAKGPVGELWRTLVSMGIRGDGEAI